MKQHVRLFPFFILSQQQQCCNDHTINKNPTLSTTTRTRRVLLQKSKVKCTHCGKIFISRNKLLSHYFEEHIGNEMKQMEKKIKGTLPPPSPPLSSLLLSDTLSTVETTMMEKNNDDNTQYKNYKKCNYCSKLFQSQQYLEIHVKCYHYKPFKCSLCNKNFRCEGYRRRHYIMKHKIKKAEHLNDHSAHFKQWNNLKKQRHHQRRRQQQHCKFPVKLPKQK